jgi:ketosteroid isomerase-like protein
MSQENVEIARRGLEHFMRTGELPWEDVDPAFEIHDHDLPDAGTYRGPDGFREWIAQWAEAWESFVIEPERYLDADDKAVALIRVSARGKGSSVPVERRDGMVWTAREGKALRLDYYGSPAEALDAAGLSE